MKLFGKRASDEQVRIILGLCGIPMDFPSAEYLRSCSRPEAIIGNDRLMAGISRDPAKLSALMKNYAEQIGVTEWDYSAWDAARFQRTADNPRDLSSILRSGRLGEFTRAWAQRMLKDWKDRPL